MAAAIEAMGPRAVPEHRLMSHYDLAKFWSARREPARAFAHWTQAHALLAKTQPFSRDAHRAFVDANIAAFRPRSAHEGAARGPTAIPRPSSSSACRARARRCASRSLRRTQRFTAPASAHRFRWHGGRSAAPDTPEAAAAHRLARRRRARRGGRRPILRGCTRSGPARTRIIDKMPGNFLYLGLVGLMLPGARIIHCVRDPRDVGLSIFTFRFYGQHPYAHDLGDLGFYNPRA